jgi:DNA repair exonuclease SbcCD ATPase subunit
MEAITQHDTDSKRALTDV